MDSRVRNHRPSRQPPATKIPDDPTPSGAAELARVRQALAEAERRAEQLDRDLRAERARLAELEENSLTRLGELAAFVAHEVKSPLAGIAGAVQVLDSHLPPKSADHAVTRAIISRIGALSHMVDELLVLGRAEHTEVTDVSLLAVLGESVALFQQSAEHAGVAVDVTGDDLIVRANAELLGSVFLNLLVNAGQAMAGRGRIGVRLEDGAGRCRLVFEDDGPGVPDEVLPRVFDLFYTTKGRGTGLGLPIAKRIVEAYGGALQVSCREGSGACVTVELPRSVNFHQ